MENEPMSANSVDPFALGGRAEEIPPPPFSAGPEGWYGSPDSAACLLVLWNEYSQLGEWMENLDLDSPAAHRAFDYWGERRSVIEREISDRVVPDLLGLLVQAKLMARFVEEGSQSDNRDVRLANNMITGLAQDDLKGGAL